MSWPASHRVAARQARTLLANRLPGSKRGTVRQHLVRSEHIAEVIWKRWQVGVYQWRLKHVLWYLQHCTDQYTDSTRYRHWLTVRKLILSLGHDTWLGRLNGPWVRPTGVRGALKAGRPVLAPSPPAS